MSVSNLEFGKKPGARTAILISRDSLSEIDIREIINRQKEQTKSLTNVLHVSNKANAEIISSESQDIILVEESKLVDLFRQHTFGEKETVFLISCNDDYFGGSTLSLLSKYQIEVKYESEIKPAIPARAYCNVAQGGNMTAFQINITPKQQEQIKKFIKGFGKEFAEALLIELIIKLILK